MPDIIPCVLYNGYRIWTVPLNYRDTLDSTVGFDRPGVDFRYTLIDVSRYSQRICYKIGNIISAVFYMDQKPLGKEFFDRLKDLLGLIKNLSTSDDILFRNWLKNILPKGMNKKETKVIETILDEEEAEQMIYELKGVFLKAKQEGKAEGRQDEKINISKKLMELGILNMEQISEVTGLSVEEL